MKLRGFEWTTKRKEKLESIERGDIAFVDGIDPYALELPKRSTKESAGYDFQSEFYVTVPSIWKQAVKLLFNKSFDGNSVIETMSPTLVRTGVKAYMQSGEVLKLYNRSSNPLKLGLVLANSVGVVDKDYYDADGEIMFAFWNFGFKDVIIQPGQKIGQGVFEQFLIADGDVAENERTGGFGSTDAK